MESWLMKFWLDSHKKKEWPDLSICQPEDACHVLKEEDRTRDEDIEKMCPKGFFTKHEYQYNYSAEEEDEDEEEEEGYEDIEKYLSMTSPEENQTYSELLPAPTALATSPGNKT